MDFTNIMSGAGAGIFKQLASQFGINSDQAASVLSTVAPALAGGLKEKLNDPAGSGLIETLTNGSLNRFAENPALLSSTGAAETGNSLLGQILGEGQLTRLVGVVSEKTGVDSGIAQKMLPVIATILTGFISRKANGNRADLTSLVSALSGGSEGVMGAVKSAASKLFG